MRNMRRPTSALWTVAVQWQSTSTGEERTILVAPLRGMAHCRASTPAPCFARGDTLTEDQGRIWVVEHCTEEHGSQTTLGCRCVYDPAWTTQ